MIKHIGVAALGFLSAFIGMDIYQFHETISHDYTNPWYKSEPIMRPYTTLRLYLVPEEDKSDYWTLNGNNSEAWLIRDIKIEKVVFWTIVERKNIDELLSKKQ